MRLRESLLAFRHSPLVVLSVVLLSGRSASILFSVSIPLYSVLGQCAEVLGFDPTKVQHTGVLLSGSKTIHSLKELEPWQVHNVTLVL